MTFTRPASLAPKTTATEQDEILRFAACAAALDTAEEIDFQGWTGEHFARLAKEIEYSVQTKRLYSYH